ncbi:MAG: FtsW/RodA/SpoVE family cell cycle protein, partial [Clostridia bacterium]|nr:FtsW/RodA/SpoVE family cell cycle protein [Clostridia bacterium]
MHNSRRDRRTDDPTADPVKANRKKSAASRMPRQSETASGRQGRAPRANSELEVQRQDVHPVKHRGDDKDIVRVKTGVDRPMLVLILLLLSLGSIMVFSASYPSALAQEGDSLFYIKKQLLFVAVGLTFMIGLSYLPPKFYKTFTVA